MAAGLGFKTFTTGEVLTAADTNGYLMQGILVFADAAARDAAITSPQEGQACYLKDTNEVLTYSGSAWVAVGGSGMTLISTGTAATSATISFTSIPQTFKELKVYVKNFKPATDAATLQMRFNSDSGANRHSGQNLGATASTAQLFDATLSDISIGNDNSVANGFMYVNFFDYTNTTTYKLALSQAITVDETTTTSYKYRSRFSVYNQTAAITSIDFFANSGNITTGTFELYGVK